MKRLLCFLWMAGCWYLAAMYRSFPLLVLGVCSAGVLLCAFLTPYFLSRKIRVTFHQSLFFLERKETGAILVTAECRGRLPLGKVSLGFWFPGEKKKSRKVSVPRLSGRQELQVPVPARVCGLHPVILKRVRVYDYLGLFSAGRRMKLQAQAVVFPTGGKLEISLPEHFVPHWEGEDTPQAALPGSSTQEIRQIRSYQPGDSYRAIHWKQSARTDSLLVREYTKEGKRGLSLVLDMHAPKPLSPRETNAFYEVLHGLLLGLVAQEVLVQVLWSHREGTACFPVGEAEGCREALLRIYETGGFSREKLPLPIPQEEGFLLDTRLQLFFRGEKIFGFSSKNYENELKTPMDWREMPWAGK